YAVVLVRPWSIPKTSSGKLQRRECRARFLAGNLDILKSSILGDSSSVWGEDSLSCDALRAIKQEERQALLESYLQKQVARVLRIAPSRLDWQQPLSTLGLDSLMVIELQ